MTTFLSLFAAVSGAIAWALWPERGSVQGKKVWTCGGMDVWRYG